MKSTARRSTVYFQPQLHKALRLKSATTQRSISDIVNDAVRQALHEDQEDLMAFEERLDEPILTYEELLKILKANDRI
jgi:plasmid stability protein